jgi:hypothetical protein
MAKLSELLTENENKELIGAKLYVGYSEMEVKDLTIQQLSNIAFILMRTEYGEKAPKCFISAEAINILTRRAIKLKSFIF